MIKSMTAFAREQSEQNGTQITWEMRSVNGRYLDMNFRLPELFRDQETKLRAQCQKTIRRGKVDCTLKLQCQDSAEQTVTLNLSAVNRLQDLLKQIKKTFKSMRKPSPFEILRWPGITEVAETNKEKLQQTVFGSFELLLKQLNEARAREGEKLKRLIEQTLEKVLSHVEKVKQHLPEILKAQRENLLQRFEDAKISLEPDRLEQEMVIVAQKMDVTEELDRLSAHVSEIKRILDQDAVAGRRLDFLMQELNREANTLGSKSVSEITSHIAVELKVLIEQMREQVQNIE